MVSMRTSRSRSSPGHSPENVQTESKVAQRLAEAVDEAEPRKNRSGDLIMLTADFETLRSNLRVLVKAVKRYGDLSAQMASSRDELVQHLARMSLKTPIYKDVGSELDENAASNLEKIKNSDSAHMTVVEVMQASQPRSLCMVQTIASAQSQVNDRDYYKHLGAYVEDWENCVTKLIEDKLKKVRQLQSDRIHYENKVDNLRQRVSDRTKSGATQVEKLSRNEAKLKEAYLLHETEADRLCTLTEAATEEGWRDLYVLVKNFMKFESNRVGRDSDIYSHLFHILESMKMTLKNHRSTKKTRSKAANDNA